MSVKIDQQKCRGCGQCTEICSVEALSIHYGKALVDEDACVECGACVDQCPSGAITLYEHHAEYRIERA